MLLRERSFLEVSLRDGRWGSAPPGWLALAARAGRALWYALWLLGPIGVVLVARRSPGWGLLALLAIYLAVALLAIPLKPRFAMPVVPLLCLFAAAAVERAVVPRSCT
jgi:hypothetical protein